MALPVFSPTADIADYPTHARLLELVQEKQPIPWANLLAESGERYRLTVLEAVTDLLDAGLVRATLAGMVA